MKLRGAGRLAALLVGVLLVTGGCFGAGGSHPRARGGSSGAGSRSGSPSGSPSPTPPPAQPEFLAALRKTQGGPFHFTVRATLPDRGAVSGSGAFDRVRKVYEAKLTWSGSHTIAGTGRRIAIGKNHFLRDPTDSQWVHLDMSRVHKDNSLVYFDLKDPIGLARFTTAVDSVKRNGPHAYRGTLNASGTDPFLPLGAPAVWVLGFPTASFTATTNAQGYVTAIAVTIEQTAKPTLVMRTTFTGHGKRLTTTAPPQYAEADSMYYK